MPTELYWVWALLLRAMQLGYRQEIPVTRITGRTRDMPMIGCIYSTVDGHTREICERLVAIVEENGFKAVLVELTADAEIDLDSFDLIVIGASIRYGKHRPEVTRFINANTAWLESRQAAFFSVNAVARKPDKKEAHTNPYVRKFLKTISWQPAIIGIFGGKIDYARYRFWDKTMIRFIMWMTGGPTDLNACVDFTDWEEVESFGRAICELAKQCARDNHFNGSRI